MNQTNAEIQNIEQALASGDKEKVLGLYRLLDIKGQLAQLQAKTLLDLAKVLEHSSMELEAAGLLRLAADKTADVNLSSAWRFHAACLLMGPAFRPEMAMGILRAMVASGQKGLIEQKAQQLMALHENGDLTALGSFLQEQGVLPPATWSEENSPQKQMFSRFEARGTITRTTKVLSAVFFMSLCAWLLGAYMKDDLAGVREISPELNSEPKQVKLKDAKPIRMRKEDNNLTLYPLFDYHICGLVVSVNSYSTLGLRYQDFFELDFCVIWGENAASGSFKAPGATFGHHGNVCYFSYNGKTAFNPNKLSNNHILTLDDDLKDKIKSVNRGDQICMDGKLVDIALVPIKANINSRCGGIPSVSRMHTSTTRTDKGMGACEIILLEDLGILSRANTIWHMMSTAGFWLALVSLMAIIVLFFKH